MGVLKNRSIIYKLQRIEQNTGCKTYQFSKKNLSNRENRNSRVQFVLSELMIISKKGICNLPFSIMITLGQATKMKWIAAFKTTL
jgi:hypothetical protein